MATMSLSRRCLQNAVKNPHIQHQTRSLAFSPSTRSLKDGVHGSSNPEKDNPLDGPAYTAEGRRHKTDNEEQRVKAENVTPAQQHAKASMNKEGNDMNKIQTGAGPSTEAGKNLKTEK